MGILRARGVRRQTRALRHRRPARHRAQQRPRTRRGPRRRRGRDPFPRPPGPHDRVGHAAPGIDENQSQGALPRARRARDFSGTRPSARRGNDLAADVENQSRLRGTRRHLHRIRQPERTFPGRVADGSGAAHLPGKRIGRPASRSARVPANPSKTTRSRRIRRSCSIQIRVWWC